MCGTQVAAFPTWGFHELTDDFARIGVCITITDSLVEKGVVEALLSGICFHARTSRSCVHRLRGKYECLASHNNHVRHNAPSAWSVLTPSCAHPLILKSFKANLQNEATIQSYGLHLPTSHAIMRFVIFCR